MQRSRFKPIWMGLACLALGSSCALASEQASPPQAHVADLKPKQQPARSQLLPAARMRMDRLTACFLSHVLQERIELACDEDLFFAPLHQSFYARRAGPKGEGLL